MKQGDSKRKIALGDWGAFWVLCGPIGQEEYTPLALSAKHPKPAWHVQAPTYTYAHAHIHAYIHTYIHTWGFTILGATYLGPYEKGILTIWRSILGVPYYRKPPTWLRVCLLACIHRSHSPAYPAQDVIPENAKRAQHPEIKEAALNHIGILIRMSGVLP